MKALLTVIGVIVALIVFFGVVVREWRYNLYTTYSAGTVADMDVTLTMAVLALTGFGICLVSIGIALGLRMIQQRNTTYYPRQDETIEGRYYELPRYQQAAQLARPAVVNVPRLINNGERMPLGAQLPAPASRQLLLRSLEDDGEEAQVPYAALLRFCSLTTPSRGEWIGAKATYTECLRFARLHGLVEERGNGVRWRDGYDMECRKRWCAQLEPRARA